MSRYRLGLDVGSTTIKAALMDGDMLIYQQYRRHRSDIRGELQRLLDDISKDCPDVDATVAFTGSGGLSVAKTMQVDFEQEVLSGTEAVRHFAPDADVVIELGGEDAKITYMHPSLEQRMNGTCAGGTGAFIDQMASLLKTDASGLNQLAEKHEHLFPIASRCGVFAKSDLQPLLNDGAAKEDLAASVFQAVVNQTIAGLAQGRPIRGNIVFLGGPLHFLPQLRERFSESLAGEGQTFSCPDHAEVFVAMGAALLSQGEEIPLHSLGDRLRHAPPIEEEITRMRKLFLDEEEKEAFFERHDRYKVERADLDKARGPVYLGIDCGSTTIKAALIDQDGRLLYSYYDKNNGDPLGAALHVVGDVYHKMPDSVYIADACVTGYGEGLIQAALRLPRGEIETLAHYKAADFFCPGVEFIIDIGGQDMKCMQVNNGVIESIMLNEACSSGCGSFIQTFAQSLGMEAPEFAEAGLDAENPVDLGTRCTVFMNSRVKQAQKEGATVGDISAGLSYSVVRNALYKVIKMRDSSQMGEKVVVQGGTFYNNAILRCFELVTDRDVIRPDISGIMGAFGSALIARERCDNSLVACDMIALSELESFEVKNELSRCNLCNNHCQLSTTIFPDGARYISGNRCERGAGIEVSKDEELPNLFDYKYKRTFDYKAQKPDEAKRGVLGIPRALNMYEDYPLWFTLFDQLGYSVQISGRSSHVVFEKGMDTIPSESVCYPAKLAHGHVQTLLDRGIKRIFYPCIPYSPKEYEKAGNHYNCPIVTSYPEVLYNNMDSLRDPDVDFIYCFINLDKPDAVAKSVYESFKPFASDLTLSEVKAATAAAFAERARYRDDIRQKGEETIDWLKANDKHGIVLAGRPYHIDPEIHHGIPDMIISQGMAVLTEDSVAHLGHTERPIRVVDQWMYHTRLYEAAGLVRHEDELDLIQLNSFGCGLDAVTTDQVQEILQGYGKIYTVLKIDEVSNLGTARIRVRSLKAALDGREESGFKAERKESATLKRIPFTKEMREKQTVIFPQMSPFHFSLLEAAFKRHGYNALVLEKATPSDVECGLKYVHNDACYPTIMVTGQIVNAFIQGTVDPDNTTVLISQTGGGCRATNYIAFIRKALHEAGFDQVPVASVNLSGLEPNPGITYTAGLLHDALKAVIWGDLLMTVLLRVRPYELVKGSANALYYQWRDKLYRALLSDKGRHNFNRYVDEILADFDALPVDMSVAKPQVGLVGEILVKFQPDANNDAVGVVEREGGEAVLPGLLDFMLYCFYNNNFKRDHLGTEWYKATAGNMGIWALERYRNHVKKSLLAHPKFAMRAPKPIEDIAEGASHVLQLGHVTGEGWFLTGEMVELIESGVPNIICMQPFACLPNHVTGKGMIKELRRQHPEANIVAVDYDPGASEVNQLNRIKLMISTAFQNMRAEKVSADDYKSDGSGGITLSSKKAMPMNVNVPITTIDSERIVDEVFHDQKRNAAPRI